MVQIKPKAVQRTIIILCLSPLAVFWVLPLWVMVVTSFKTQAEMAKRLYLFPPAQATWEYYTLALDRIGRGLLNSVIVSLPATFLSVFIGSLGGYFLSMFGFKHSRQLFFVIAIATFLPYEVVLIPVTQFIRMLHLVNTYPGLILTYTILNSPLATLVTATFFLTFPKEIHEAASLDGCSPTHFFWRILVPLSMAGLVSTTLLVFTIVWNEFLLALTLTQGPEVKTVVPALANLKGTFVAMWNLQMAGAFLTALPPMVLFIVLGKYFAEGIVASALKG